MTQQDPTLGTMEISDLNQFVTILTAWHERGVKTLEHLLEVPEGVEMQVGDAASVKLEGDVLAGFKAGVQLGLMELGILPFVAEMEPHSDAPAAH